MIKNGNRTCDNIRDMLFGDGLHQTEDYGMDIVGGSGVRGFDNDVSADAGTGRYGFDACSPCTGGDIFGVKPFDKGKSGEGRWINAVSAGAFTGMEAVPGGSLYSVSVDRHSGGCRDYGRKAASGQQTAVCTVSSRSSDTGRAVRENRMRSGSADGYVVVEAAVLLPLASLIMVLLVWLGSYLYQSCFLSQAAYIAAFRGSRFPERGAGYVQRELEELMDGEVLRFSEESFRVDSGILSVTVVMIRETPFSRLGGTVRPLYVKRRAAVREAVPYIRGRRLLEGMQDTGGNTG